MLANFKLFILFLLMFTCSTYGASLSPVGSAYRKILKDWPVLFSVGRHAESGIISNRTQKAAVPVLPQVFDSEDDRVDLPTSLLPDTSKCLALSLVMWFRIEDLTRNAFLAGFQSPADDTKFVFAAQYTSKVEGIQAYVKYGLKSGDQRQTLAHLPVNDTEWHLLALSWDGRQLAQWLDGAVQIVACDNEAKVKLLRADNFSVGGAVDLPGRCLHGGIDGVAVMGRSLTNRELWALRDSRNTVCKREFKGKKSELKELLPERGLCAHRGANSIHPENTIAAFREAVRLGAHMIELDVYATADNQLAVLHDATVNRTTDGKGKVGGFTWSEIRKLDAGSWKNQFFAGEQIPSLREVFAVVPVNVWLNLHTKGDRKLGEAVASEVLAYNRGHQCFVAGPSDVIDGARSVWPDVLVCNMTNQGYDSAYVDDTLSRNSQFIQFYLGMGSEADVQRLKKRNVRVNYCCTNNSEELKKLLKAGVDFPLVDRLKSMMRVAEECEIKPLEPIWWTSEMSEYLPPLLQ